MTIVVAAGGVASAHNDPGAPSSTGITISLTAFLADGVTPAIPAQPLAPCEKIFLRATLAWAGGVNAAFEGGTWTITIPDGAGGTTSVNVTPSGGVPCLTGPGATDDPNSGSNGGRGLCATEGVVGDLNSELVPYTVTAADIDGLGKVNFRTDLTGAFAHVTATDISGVEAGTPINLSVTECSDDFCTPEICDPAAVWGDFEERLGACVADDPPVCDDCEVCDESVDACVNTPDPTDCTCVVQVDKQVSCDGGQTWDDVDQVTNNEDGTNGCMAGQDQPIQVRYRATNSGDRDAVSCTLGESNTAFGVPPGGSFTIPAAANNTDGAVDRDAPNTPTCTEAVGDEPNTVTLNCTCDNDENTERTATDRATFQCPSIGSCRMTGGHNVFYGLVEGATSTPRGSGRMHFRRLRKSGQAVEYTTGGQIGAPNAQGCCDVPPDSKCIDGFCFGGPEHGEECADNGECPSSTGRGSDCPWGNWQHSHHGGAVSWTDGLENGEFGSATSSFSFHSGTGSSPQAAFIQQVKCDDPGWCVQARCAPFKQIYWEGTGVFRNFKDADFGACEVVPSSKQDEGTVHYYKAHVGDFGEPAGGKQNGDGTCDWQTNPDWDLSLEACTLSDPANNVGGIECSDDDVCTSVKGGAGPGSSCDAGQCVPREPFVNRGGEMCESCADWYEIEIHCTEDPLSPIIYKVGNFIRQGNFQIHPEVGVSCHDVFGTVE